MILLTNDDGIGAPGLECARRFFAGTGEEVLVVAPHVPVSQCGHSITTDEPMTLEERAENVFALSGKPADCVRVGLKVLLKNRTGPRWVVSGVNYGANLGVDVYVSGTVAAAREAALLGVSAVALSIYYRSAIDLADWDGAQLERVWAWLGEATLGEGEFWNVNFPHPVPGHGDAEIVECAPSRRPLPVDYRREGGRLVYVGDFNSREREGGSDVAQCFGGKITVSRLRV